MGRVRKVKFDRKEATGLSRRGRREGTNLYRRARGTGVRRVNHQ